MRNNCYFWPKISKFRDSRRPPNESGIAPFFLVLVRPRYKNAPPNNDKSRNAYWVVVRTFRFKLALICVTIWGISGPCNGTSSLTGKGKANHTRRTHYLHVSRSINGPTLADGLRPVVAALGLNLNMARLAVQFRVPALASAAAQRTAHYGVELSQQQNREVCKVGK